MNDAVARDAVSRLLRAYARTHPGLTTVGFLSTLVVPIQDVLLPHLTGSVVNAIRSGDGRSMRRSIVWVGVAMLVVQLAFVLVDMVDARLFPSMQKFVRRRMMDCMLDTHDAAYSAELPVGEILSKFARTPPMLVSWFEAVKGMLPNLLVYVAATAYFWCIDAWLGVGLLAAVVASFASLAYNLEHCGDVSAERDRTLHAVHEQLDEVLHNLPAIYAAGTKADEARRIEPIEDEFERLYFRTIVCSTAVKAWMVPACIALVAGVLWRCYVLLRARRLDVGKFVAVFSVVLYLMASMMRVVAHSRSMVYYWGTVQSSLDMLSCPDRTAGAVTTAHSRGAPAAAKVAAAAGTSVGSVGSVGAVGAAGAVAPLLSLRGVTYVHAGSAAGAAAVRGVDLELRAGERLAIVGRMGSGKTTLLKLMLRLVEPSAGELRWAGRPYASMSVASVRAHFGYVPQSAPLFDRTVLENAVYGTPADALPAAARLERARAVAAEIGLTPVFEELPDGLDTRVGKGGSRLSGGQRQAVWILRMALLRPDVLVLDEATASMDPASQAAVAAAVSRFPTAVVVSHDPGFVAMVATRTVVIDAGRVDAAAAPPAQVADPDGGTPPAADDDDDGDGDGDGASDPTREPEDLWSYSGAW